ncbi:monocarboxylate transporter 12-like [Asterias amurensis]|uniref:monocarboxylate transporter 12-like n=1 Tax=Asterias amurensis TaxID=7602 RepID=UPI003AB36F67
MQELPGQDGGLYGWVAVLTAWSVTLIWTVFFKGLGIMLPTLQEQFGTTTTLTGWVIAAICTTAGAGGIFAGLVGRRFGTGVSVMMCGFMVGAACVAGSFSSSIVQLFLILMVFASSGLGLSRVLAKAAIVHRFQTNFATAVGVSKTGGSIGFLFFAPLTQIFLDTYGWSGTLLLIGAISFHLAVCGALMVVVDKRRTSEVRKYDKVEQEENQSGQETNHRCSTLWKCVVDSFDMNLLRNPRYWAAATIYCSTRATLDMWTIFFVSMAQSKGFSPEDAAIFVTVAGVGNVLSKLIQGFIVDRVFKSYLGFMFVMLATSSAMFCATPWLDSYWLMMMSSFSVLFCLGVLTCLQDLLFKQVFGVERMVGVYGWLGLKTGALRLAIEFLPGLLYDLSGNFDGAFIFIGVVQSLGMVPLVVLMKDRRMGVCGWPLK